jgi:hypothetical protein
MPYTSTRLGQTAWGIFHNDRLLATVMTKEMAQRILVRLSHSKRTSEIESATSAVLPIQRSHQKSRQMGRQAV